MARWRYEEDQPGYPHTIRFTDLSFYDPEDWTWDFEDGNTSAEMSPVHTFETGLYHVCLTVSNSNASDSSCQWIEILETGIQNDPVNGEQDLSISPNPFDDELGIRSLSGVFRKASIQLYDIHGRIVFSQDGLPVPVNIFLPSLPSGMYLCSINEHNGDIHNFKVMKK